MLFRSQKTMGWRISFTVPSTYSGRNWRQMLSGTVFYKPDVAKQVFAESDYGPMLDEGWRALKSFKGPVRVIIGTHDYLDLGPTHWPKVVDALPNAQLHTIQNAGHYIWMDEPEAFTQSLRTALEATVARE